MHRSRRVSLIVSAALPLGSSATRSAAQATASDAARATVRVQVLDSAAGTPVARAGVQASGWAGLAWTDSAGRFRMTGVPARSELRVRCPTTRRLAGRVAHRRPLDLPAGADTQLVVRISAAGCAEPPIRSVRVDLRGHYTSGFESSDFRPCGGLPAESAVYDTTWGNAWVEFAPSVRGHARRWPTFPDSLYYPTVYVRWRGILTGPGAYGHMGAATYQLLVDEILEVRRARANDCR